MGNGVAMYPLTIGYLTDGRVMGVIGLRHEGKGYVKTGSIAKAECHGRLVNPQCTVEI